MCNHGTGVRYSAITSVMFMLVVLGAIATAAAQVAPRSFVASPDVYKVVAENEQYLVIEVTWKPGQRDQFHSHPVAGTYWLTDCAVRVHAPDGTFQESSRTAGRAGVQSPIASHSFENISKADCRLIMFEPK
jgi:hypothetical protein